MKKIFVLPFDHRISFLKKMFGISGELSSEDLAKGIEFKKIIYKGFVKAAEQRMVPREQAAILVDEQFGDEVIRDATEKGFIVCIPVEKSGQDEFDFEYGSDFEKHIEKYKPKIVKALVRYNPAGDEDMNARQRQRLKKVSDYCKKNGYMFMIEPLIPPTLDQLEVAEHNQSSYDNEIRPKLTVTMIAELQDAGVEPDIWKIEGFENPDDYKKAVEQIKFEGREHSSAIILGRGADDEQVETWLMAGAGTNGVIGFAVGRTIFWKALEDFKNGIKNEEEASAEIANRFGHFYDVFIKAEKNH